jgi:hypothetical protein
VWRTLASCGMLASSALHAAVWQEHRSTQAKTGGELNTSLARTRISLK